MKRNIWILNMGAALIWMAMYAYMPVLPVYAQVLGATATMVGIIGGVYGVTQALLRFPLGVLSDKIGRDKLLLMIGFAILLASTVILVFLEGIVWILIARALAGAAAAWWVILCVSYGRYFPEHMQVKAQGSINMWANGGKFISAILCGVVMQYFGYKGTFAIAMIFALVGLVGIACLKPVKIEPTARPPIKTSFRLFSNKQLMAFSVLGLLAHMLCFAIPTTFTPIAAKALGANGFELGMLTFVYFGGAAVASFFVGTKAYHKLGGIHVMALGFLLGAVSCIPVFYQINLIVVYSMQILSGVCFGLVTSITAGYVQCCVIADHRGSAMGIFQSVFSIGIFIGPVLTGWMVDAVSFDAAFWLIGAITLFAAILCYIVVPKEYSRMT